MTEKWIVSSIEIVNAVEEATAVTSLATTEEQAMDQARQMIRDGAPYVYIARVLGKVEMQVQVTTMIERKPLTQAEVDELINEHDMPAEEGGG